MSIKTPTNESTANALVLAIVDSMVQISVERRVDRTLENDKTYAERIHKEIFSKIEILRKRIENAVLYLQNHDKWISVERLTEIENIVKKLVANKDFKTQFGHTFLQFLGIEKLEEDVNEKNKSIAGSQPVENDQPQRPQLFSHQEQLDIYKEGLAAYEEKLYPDASDIFFLLTVITPSVPEFWYALASAEEQNQNYVDAIVSFMLAANLETKDLKAYINAANLMVLIGKKEEAKIFLKEALERSKNDELLKNQQEDVEAVYNSLN